MSDTASSAKPKTAITPTRAENFPEWYQQIIRAADMADNADVRGCMVMKPWGYGIWELMQRELDRRIKATGHKNAYFPLFIPLSYLAKEAEHVEGFAKECAVVTHHRLVADGKGGLKPDGELTEPLIIRPTSETIIGASFAKWAQSYRDLPILINQWANVVRWEMRPRVFLRTTEFLWQEGHTAHETRDEAIDEAQKMLGQYIEFAQQSLAVPVMHGPKSPTERFAGADDTLTIEAMAQDGKAIQAGTSHFLGQHFSKANGIKFVGRDNSVQYAWTASWGVSTRLIGTLLMAHSDDDGLVLPPAVAPSQVVILPVLTKPEAREKVLGAANEFKARLEKLSAFGYPVRVEVDDRDIGGGTKKWEWIKKGAPVRVEIGPRDLESGNVVCFKRVDDSKAVMPMAEFEAGLPDMLVAIRDEMFARAKAFRDAHTREIRTPEELESYFASLPEGQTPGFVVTPWEGFEQYETAFKEKYNVTVRCLPTDIKIDGKQTAIWAQSY